jgi:glutaredoxin-dependent peroxiredoxin
VLLILVEAVFVVKIKVGDVAPSFSLPDTENRTRSLWEFLGQRVVLVFSVEAFTLNATKEVCEFRDVTGQLTNLDAKIVGLNVDLSAKNKVFAQRNRLAFPILSDSKHEIMKAYGLKTVGQRALFVLDEKGVVVYRWVSEKTSDEPDFEEINIS